MLTGAAFAVADRLMDPLVPVPGLVIVAVTPAGKPVTSRVTTPAKLVRLTVMLTDCAAPPAVNDNGPPALTEMDGAAETVRLNVVVALETPAPMAVTVIVWLLTDAAFAAAVSITEPLFPAPGSVGLAVTPAGNPVTFSATLPL